MIRRRLAQPLKFTSGRGRSVPLRVAIAAPFLVLVLLAASVTAGLSLERDWRAVAELTEQVALEVNAGLELELQTVLEAARRGNRMTAAAIARSDLGEQAAVRALEPLLFDTLQVFPELATVGFARDTDGAAIAVSRAPQDRPGSDEYFVEYADATTGRDFWSFRVDSQRRRLDAGNLKVRDLDIRERPWYGPARARAGASWSAPYPSLDRVSRTSPVGALAMNANLPVRDRNGTFLGFATAILNLQHFDAVLREFEASGLSQLQGRRLLYLVDRDGYLIGTSDNSAVMGGSAADPQPLLATESPNASVRASARQIARTVEGGFAAIDRFAHLPGADSDRFVCVQPLAAGELDWVSVILAPRADVLEQVRANIRQTLAVGAVATLGVLGLGLVVARAIARPLEQFEQATRALAVADGDPSEPQPTASASPIRELQGLALAFDRMRDRLQQTLRDLRCANDDLETRVVARTAELQTAREAAEAGNRAKGRFLANMSHELRTPLNAILGFAHALERDPQLSPSHREQLGAIARSGAHLLELIEDGLEIARLDNGRVEVQQGPCDLDALLGDLETLFAPQVATGVALRCCRDPDVPHWFATDGGKLRQVLSNLLGNAVKFTDWGTIALHVRVASEAADRIELEFAVTDTGPGIAPDDCQRIFEPFAQAAGDRARGGTGLGLSISRQYARLLGGTLQVGSILGCGSTFTLRLPVLPVASPGSDAPDSSSAPVAAPPVELLAARSPIWIDRLHRAALRLNPSEVEALLAELPSGSPLLATLRPWADDFRYDAIDNFLCQNRRDESPRGPESAGQDPRRR